MLRWSAVMEGGDISRPAALLIDATHLVVAVSAGPTLYEVDAADGTILWSATPSRAGLTGPVVDARGIVLQGAILVGDTAGALFAIDPVLGTFTQLEGIAGELTAPPSDGGSGPIDVVEGDDKGTILGFDTTDGFGPPVWQTDVAGPVHGPPAMANGVVYVGTVPARGDPWLYALDDATGRTSCFG